VLVPAADGRAPAPERTIEVTDDFLFDQDLVVPGSSPGDP
jgi:hypothetical protein